MKIMDENVTVTAEEQYAFAEQFVAMGRRLQRRSLAMQLVVQGDIVSSPNVVEQALDVPQT